MRSLDFEGGVVDVFGHVGSIRQDDAAIERLTTTHTTTTTTHTTTTHTTIEG